MAAFVFIRDIVNRRNLKRERVFRDRSSALDTLDDIDLISRYRFPRHVILQLTDSVETYLRRGSQRSFPISPQVQVLCTLRYFAKGGFLSEIADLHGISKSSLSLILDSTTKALVNTLTFISFPPSSKHKDIMQGFHELCGLPKVLGCIDGTLIPIQRPRVDEVAYVSRKGYHAINVQAVCDAQLRFTNVVVLWPGSTHDAHIFNHSQLKRSLEGKSSGWLLGDSGYPCKPYLLTPLLNPASASEEKYNKAHIGTRNSIERAFGVCKSRFRCLHKTSGCLLFEPDKCIRIITACMQLHNLAVALRLPDPQDGVVPHQEEDDFSQNQAAQNVDPAIVNDGQQVRRMLIQSRFSSKTNRHGVQLSLLLHCRSKPVKL